MAMNPLPPQAYTKDTLVKAYNWLALQGPSIKELATTTDVMVSLFLKAQRDGISSLENPSIQNFKNELKTLTTMLGNFDIDEGKGGPTEAPISSKKTEVVAPPLTEPSVNLTAGAVRPPETPPITTQPPLQPQPLLPKQTPPKTNVVEINLSEVLDQKSIFMIQEIKNFYNLSNDKEALRMIIKIGYVKALGLYKSI